MQTWIMFPSHKMMITQALCNINEEDHALIVIMKQ